MSGELDEDLESLNFSKKYDVRSENNTYKGSAFTLTTIEQVDELIDHSIEIESNKRMRNANVNPWTLRFKDSETEYQVRPPQNPTES